MIDMKNMSKNAICPPKRIAAIHDMSCFGRCALTVVIPSLSSMGYQVIPVPTALLSSHTGGFDDMYFEDLTHFMNKTAEHFDRLDIKFDAIYTGFLGSEEQIDVVLNFIKRFSDKDTLIFVDPVMGDDGVLYSTYNDVLRNRMKELCSVAHVITPNLTEACFLCDEPYKDTSDMNEKEVLAFANAMSAKLKKLGKATTVITGIPHKDVMFGTYTHTEECGGYMYSVKRVQRSYPGTGDLFASVLLGCMLQGDDLDLAVRFASDYIRNVMDYSANFGTPEREGVAFEHLLGELVYHRRS